MIWAQAWPMGIEFPEFCVSMHSLNEEVLAAICYLVQHLKAVLVASVIPDCSSLNFDVY